MKCTEIQVKKCIIRIILCSYKLGSKRQLSFVHVHLVRNSNLNFFKKKNLSAQDKTEDSLTIIYKINYSFVIMDMKLFYIC